MILDFRLALDEPNCARREAETVGIRDLGWLVQGLQGRDERYALPRKLDPFLLLSVLDLKAFCASSLAV
jgi:hypothetical protein